MIGAWNLEFVCDMDFVIWNFWCDVDSSARRLPMFTPGQHVAEHVDDYLHDLLAAVDDTHVEQHCRDCDACAKALADARKRQALLEAVPPHEVSGELVRKTLEGIGI